MDMSLRRMGRRTILVCVVMGMTAVTLWFKEQSMPVVDTKVVRTQETKFLCGLLSEIDFSYPEFSGWRIVPGESATLDGNVSCAFGVRSESLGQVVGFTVIRRPYWSPVGEREIILRNEQGVAYEYQPDLASATTDARGSYDYVSFYNGDVEYRLELIDNSKGEFPANEFFEQVITTFRVL